MEKPKNIEGMIFLNEKIKNALDRIMVIIDNPPLSSEEVFSLGSHICGIALKDMLESGVFSKEELSEIFAKSFDEEKTSTGLVKHEPKVINRRWWAKKPIDIDDDFS